jgi:hypothetical protein
MRVTMSPSPRLVPEDFSRSDLDRSDRRALFRALAASCLAVRHRQKSASAIAEDTWPRDYAASGLLTKGATAPHSTTNTAALTQLRVEDLTLLAPTSGAMRLFAGGTRLTFDKVSTYTLPSVATHSTGRWVDEGAAIPVAQPALTSIQIGPPKKLSAIASISDEMLQASSENLPGLIAAVIGESLSYALDAQAFSTNAATSATPAGLLAGLSSITPSLAAATRLDTAVADIANMSAAFASSMVSDEGMTLVLTPDAAQRLKLSWGYASPPINMIASLGVAPKRAIAVIPRGLFYGVTEGGAEISKHATLVMDDTAPGSPDTGTKVIGSFQTDTIAIKISARVTWAALAHTIQYVDNVAW